MYFISDSHYVSVENCILTTPFVRALRLRPPEAGGPAWTFRAFWAGRSGGVMPDDAEEVGRRIEKQPSNRRTAGCSAAHRHLPDFRHKVEQVTTGCVLGLISALLSRVPVRPFTLLREFSCFAFHPFTKHVTKCHQTNIV